jgi:hypothetical protein
MLGSCDHIITFFFLDVLDHEDFMQFLLLMTKNYSHSKTQWHWIDFYDQGYFWQKALLTIMYRFFAYVSRLHNQKILPFSDLMQTQGWHLLRQDHYVHGFIRSESLCYIEPNQS